MLYFNTGKYSKGSFPHRLVVCTFTFLTIIEQVRYYKLNEANSFNYLKLKPCKLKIQGQGQVFCKTNNKPKLKFKSGLVINIEVHLKNQFH